MIVRNIKSTSNDGGGQRLQAEVLYETEAVTESYFIQYTNPEKTADDHPGSYPGGDVFLVALLLPAMAVGERLRIEAPVSESVSTALLNNTIPLMLKQNSNCNQNRFINQLKPQPCFHVVSTAGIRWPNVRTELIP
jgi:hypothetical protein